MVVILGCWLRSYDNSPFLRCCIESFISGNISIKVRSICCLLSVVFMLSIIIGVGGR